VGDSITEGTKNGGYGWYEPIAAMYPNKEISSFAKGAMTSKYFRDNAESIADIQAGLYVVAFGCNDIRYRNPKVCAMNSREYIENIDVLVDTVRRRNDNARFVFIAPWMSMCFDANFNGSGHDEKMAMYDSYTSELQIYCKKHGFLFINPNPLIFENLQAADITIRGRRPEDILIDFIHPNAGDGIRLYSEAVINSKIV